MLIAKLLRGVGVVAFVICVSLSGCYQVDDTIQIEKDNFLGTWQNTTLGFTTTMTFFSNATCKVNTGNGTWDVQDGKLILTLKVNNKSTVYDYAFSNNTLLMLTPESQYPRVTYVYTKQ